MIKNLIRMNLFLIVGLALLGCKEKETSSRVLVLGTSSDNPPFEYFSTEQGRIVGFDIDLAQEIAQEIGAELKIKDMDFNALIPAVSSGRIDLAMASITPTNKRKESVDFSDIYLKTKAGMVTRKSDDIRYPDDFGGKKIGVQLGSSHEAFLKQVHENADDFQLVSLNKTGDLIQELLNNRIDVVVLGERPAMEYAKKNENLEFNSMESSIVSFAIAFKKNSPLVDEINKIIEKLQRNGRIDQLQKKWLK